MTFGRVTTNMLQRSTSSDIRNNNRDLLELQKQLSTGRAITNISDNPLGVNRVLDFDVTISENDQFIKNVNNGLSELGITDSAIDSMHAMIIRSKEIALSQINGTSSTETREAAAQEVQQILKQIVAISNTQIGDNFIFGGSNNTKQPFSLEGNEVVYNGDDQDKNTQISRDVAVATNIPGSRAFGVFQDKSSSSFSLEPQLQDKVFVQSALSLQNVPAGYTAVLTDLPAGVDLKGVELIVTSGQNEGVSTRITDFDATTGAVRFETDNLPVDLVEGASVALVQSATLLSDLNGGDGVSVGLMFGSIGDKNVTIDLSKAINVTDIKTIIEKSFEGAVEVSFNAGGKGFSITNLTNEAITLKEEGRNSVGRELGLINKGVLLSVGVGETFDGQNITPKVSASTSLDKLNGGAGFNYLGFRIKSGSAEKIFDANTLESVSTVGDLLNLINSSGIDVEASLSDDGRGVQIKGRSSGEGIFIDDVMAKGVALSATNTNVLNVGSSFYQSDSNELVGAQMLIKGADGSVYTREILSYDGGNITLSDNIDVVAGESFEVFSSRRFTGRVESADQNSLVDTGAFVNSSNILLGGLIRITEGAGAGQEFRITGSTDDKLIFNNPLGIQLDSSSTYEVVSGTATSLGINSFNTGTSVSSLHAGKNITLTEFEITYGADQKTATVDVHNARTLQDVIEAIQKSTDYEVNATLVNGNSIKLEDSHESSKLTNKITITEVGSGTAAKELGLLGVEGEPGTEFIGSNLDPRTKEDNIFTALFDLIKGLLGDDLNALNNAGKSIDKSLSVILDGRAEVGARLNRFDLTKSRLEDQQVFLQELRSQTLDADYIDLVLQFNNKNAIVEANLKAVGNLLNISLLDYI